MAYFEVSWYHSPQSLDGIWRRDLLPLRIEFDASKFQVAFPMHGTHSVSMFLSLLQICNWKDSYSISHMGWLISLNLHYLDEVIEFSCICEEPKLVSFTFECFHAHLQTHIICLSLYFHDSKSFKIPSWGNDLVRATWICPYPNPHGLTRSKVKLGLGWVRIRFESGFWKWNSGQVRALVSGTILSITYVNAYCIIHI